MNYARVEDVKEGTGLRVKNAGCTCLVEGSVYKVKKFATGALYVECDGNREDPFTCPHFIDAHMYDGRYEGFELVEEKDGETEGAKAGHDGPVQTDPRDGD